MLLTDTEQKTVNFYDANAPYWAEQHNAFQQNFWEGALRKFQELLSKGSVLEIGAGGGRDAKLLIDLGYEYTGTDVSRGLLEVARANNPGATFREMSVYDLDFPDSSFDAFWAVAVLLHIPRGRLPEALAEIVRVVKDNGLGFIGVKEGTSDDVEVDERGERLFVYYAREEFEQALAAAGLEVINFEYQPVTERTKWLKFLVRVHKEN